MIKSADNRSTSYAHSIDRLTDPALCVAWCRYPNDTYDGYQSGQRGNPWVLCSAAIAELSYVNAQHVASAASGHTKPIAITDLNRRFYTAVVGAAIQNGIESSAVVVELQTHSELSVNASGELARALLANGDDILQRIKYHTAGGDFHQAEELNRDTGFEQGAGDLSWSYGGILSALMARDAAADKLAGK